MHGEGSVDQRAVNGDQLSQLSVLFGQALPGFGVQRLKDILHLLQAPGIDGLEEAALLDAACGGDTLAGKVILFQKLQEVPA